MADLILEGTSTPITTTAAVRLTAGIDVSEYPDSAFSESGVLEELEIDLNEWLGEAGLSYVTIIGLGGTASTSPDARQDFLNLKKYAKYKLAMFVLNAMGLGFAKKLSDGQDSFERFAKDQEEVLRRFEEVSEEAKAAILAAHGTDTQISSPLSGVSNDYDPVTGS